jgi:hypothetical protein
VTRHKVVVVDGSNLATEARVFPSLAQLDESVKAFLAEEPSEMIVVVDATFEHRIDKSERARFKEAELAGELVTPPAGAIGRGDAFILKIAKRAGAVVLSNDSFQEFHAEHPWLFDEGRLIGGKPIPGVGWIFTARNPVRGPVSRAARARATTATGPEAAAPATGSKRRGRATSDATADEGTRQPRGGATVPAGKPSTKVAAAKPASSPTSSKRAAKPAADGPTPPKAARRASPAKAGARAKSPAPAAATPKAVTNRRAPSKSSRGGAQSAPTAQRTASQPPGKSASRAERQAPAAARSKPSAEPVNTERSFRSLTTKFALGGEVEGEVVQFTSHGAMVSVSVSRSSKVVCYAPLAGLGTPAPTKARDVLKMGEKRRFTIVAFDPTRRRAELALGFA